MNLSYVRLNYSCFYTIMVIYDYIQYLKASISFELSFLMIHYSIPMTLSHRLAIE